MKYCQLEPRKIQSDHKLPGISLLPNSEQEVCKVLRATLPCGCNLVRKHLQNSVIVTQSYSLDLWHAVPADARRELSGASRARRAAVGAARVILRRSSADALRHKAWDPKTRENGSRNHEKTSGSGVDDAADRFRRVSDHSNSSPSERRN